MKFLQFLKQYIPFLIAALPALVLRDFSPSDELRYISTVSYTHLTLPTKA